jgi:hypothetical protein
MPQISPNPVINRVVPDQFELMTPIQAEAKLKDFEFKGPGWYIMKGGLTILVVRTEPECSTWRFMQKEFVRTLKRPNPINKEETCTDDSCLYKFFTFKKSYKVLCLDEFEETCIRLDERLERKRVKNDIRRRV